MARACRSPRGGSSKIPYPFGQPSRPLSVCKRGRSDIRRLHQDEPRGVGCGHLARERLYHGAQPLQRAGRRDHVQPAPPRGEDVRLGAAHDDLANRPTT